jgi:hypothetical protein
MKIGDNAPVGKPSSARRKSAVSGSADGFFGLFNTAQTEATENAAPPAAALPPASLGDLLSLQEVTGQTAADGREQRKQALDEGEKTLQALDELHQGLLRGSVPQSLLPRLAGMSARQAGDPAAQELLDQIALRAQVELAKLERAAKRS